MSDSLKELLFGTFFILCILSLISHVPFHKLRRAERDEDGNDLFV